MLVTHLYISPGHNFFGHHGQPAGRHATLPLSEVECVAGRGLMGDRFFDYKENYKGQITFFAEEVWLDLCARFGVAPADRPPGVFRRNVVTRGADLNSLIGRDFTLQGVVFEGVAECTPCYWMDQSFAVGAHAALAGRGGLRARILTDGVLRVDALFSFPVA